MPIYLTAMKPTFSVTEGFLSAAARLGLSVILLTDRVEDHLQEYQGSDHKPAAIELANVNDPADVASRIAGLRTRFGKAEALLSNSDHLQFSTSAAAELLGLPTKDWRAALRCKNKALTRQTLADAGLDSVFSLELRPDQEPTSVAETLPYPVVLKPREGVATEDVAYISNPAEFIAAVAEIRKSRGPVALVVEEYLTGKFYSYDTLGDGDQTLAFGSWHTELSAPPLFHELRDQWHPELPASVVDSLNAQLSALGVNFGACHTEFVSDGERARIIEVNYRLIGGGMDAFTSQVLDLDLFAEVISLHQGAELSSELRAAVAGAANKAARVEYVFAEQPGQLTSAPPTSDTVLEGSVRLIHCPLQDLGSTVTAGNTKRDFLSAVQGIGADDEAVQAAIAGFVAANSWTVTS